MTNTRTPNEIKRDIDSLKWKLRDLEEELKKSEAIYKISDKYNKYKNKWVVNNRYEDGIDYIYVLGFSVCTEDELVIYGYGISYDGQSYNLYIISSDYPQDFCIDYPDQLSIIDRKEIIPEITELLKEEFESLS